MPCEAPIPAFRPANGGPVRFNEPKDGQAYIAMEIPCGTCILCREEHARQWAVRITHESQLHDECCFATFTYSPKHLPKWGSLQYADMQKFWDRTNKARKRAGLPRLHYYAVGEYGDQTQRPHYHACIFGSAYTENRIILRTSPTMLWTSPELEKEWGLGNVSVGALNYETARYTASYVTKKLRAKQQYVRVDETSGELIPLEQPKAYMSLKPAIGLRWLEQYGDHIYENDYVVINGKKQKPPQYYDRWLKKRSEIPLQMIKEERQKKAQSLSISQLRARARVAHARVKGKPKKL